MALKDIVTPYNQRRDGVLTGTIEEKVVQHKEEIKKYIAFWRQYPDIFVDFLCGRNPENFSLFFYQRVFLRFVMRHKYAYATFPRA